MNKKQLDLELFLFILIFGVSLLVRILLLGKAPLSVSESSLAYQAWELAQGQDVHLGSQVGYLTLTEMLFSLLGSGNAIARFLPAFVGSFLIWVPFFFRFQLGRKAALVIALGLALDPGMVAASRVVGGKMMAVTFFLLALGMLWNGKRFWAVFFGGMAILSGPFLWMGILGAVITFGIVSSLGFVESPLQIWKGISKSDSSCQEGKIPWYLILGSGLIILIATSFLQHYQGFSAWASSLPAFLTGWFQQPFIPPGRLFVAIFVYQPLALIFGLIVGFKGLMKKQKKTSILMICFLVLLILALLYPGRQVIDLIWCTIPLWSLAGIGLVKNWGKAKNSWVTSTQAVIVFVLFALAWLSFVGLTATGGGGIGVGLQWGMIGATFLLIILTTVIVAGEWGWLVAQKGLIMGVTVAMGVYVLAAMAGVAYLRHGDPRELWSPIPGGGQSTLLIESLGDVGLLESGRQEYVEIVALTDTPVLPWVLREFDTVDFYNTIPQGYRPSVVITKEIDRNMPWTAAYRGQDFVLEISPAWDKALPGDWKRWLAYRESPLWEEKYILWVRWDIFPFIESEDMQDNQPLQGEFNQEPGEE